MLQGISVGFLAYGLFSWSDACVKALGGRLPVFEIIFFITLFSLVTFAWGKPPGERWREMFHLHRPGIVALRGIGSVVGGLCSVYAFTTLPLAEAYALLFLMPAFATMLSIPFLGEKIGWRRWLAVLVGFAGVLLVVRPGFRELHLGHLAGAVGGVAGAMSLIVLRTLGSTERRISLLGVIFLSAIAVNAVLMIPTFRLPAPTDFAILLFAGTVGGFGQIAMIVATRMAPANRIAPAQYSQMLWAVTLGGVFFGEFPDHLALLGLALIALSGLFTFFREEQLRGWSRRTILMRNRP